MQRCGNVKVIPLAGFPVELSIIPFIGNWLLVILKIGQNAISS